MTHNTSTNYAYKTWFDVMASFSPDVKKYRLQDGGSYFFDPEHLEDFTSLKKKTGPQTKRVFDKINAKIVSQGGRVVCRCELFLDVLNVHKYFIHENQIKLELIRNSDEFLLMYDHKKEVAPGAQKIKYAIKFKKVELYYKIIKPSSQIRESHDNSLSKGEVAMIPFTQTELSHRLIHPQSCNYQLFRIVNGPIIPKKIFVMFLNQENFNGQEDLNPFHFKHFDIKDITFKWYTRCFPSDRYNLKWSENEEQGLLELYHHFMDAIGIKNGNATNGISLQKFRDFFPVFVFDRAPDACNGAHTHIPENGFIDLEFEVKDALRVPIIAIIYSQYDKILTWKRSKGKGVDYAPEVEVINNFSVKGGVNEESVNY